MSLPFIGTLGTPENWMWFLAGVAAWAVIQNLILPDTWAVWLAQRRNLPGILQVLAVLGLVISLGWNILVLAVGGALLQALSRARVELWVWVVLGVSILLLVTTWLFPRLVNYVLGQLQAQRQQIQMPGPQP